LQVRDYYRNQRLAHLYVLHELLRIDQGPDNSLHPKAEQVLGRHHPNLMRELFDLLRELFKENPPVIAGERGQGGGGAVRKREWVAQRVSELSEVVGCMVIAGYYRYRMQGDQAGLVMDMLSFMQEADFSMPAAFRAYIPAASEVAKKARSFSFTLALVGIEALDLQSVDSPEDLVERHALLRDFNNHNDPAAMQVARERLGFVNEVVASMMDSHKSERRAVR
ncbi:unnamed protein product, partial [Hapterophycus canaliculatus]